MKAALRQHNWARFLELFNEHNRLRPTRIGVFEGPPDAMADYWIEDGLPLTGLDIDAHGPEGPNVEIMLGDATQHGAGHLTHVVKNTRFLKIVLSAAGVADSLEIQGGDGRTTVLQFEEKDMTVV
jgi:hypothetical protein